MSSSETRRNDQYAWIDEMAPSLHEAARTLIDKGEAARVSDAAVAEIITAGLRLFVAKSYGEERNFPPLSGRFDENITATEVLSAVAELLRALRLGPMELALWYRPRPDEKDH